MKRNKSARQPAPVTRKQLAIPRDPGQLPAEWYQGITPAEVADGDDSYSAVFLRFAAPLIDGNEPQALLHTKYGVAMMGWNLAMLPPHARVRALAKLLAEFEVDLRLNLKGTLQELVERKETSFHDNRWLISSFHLEPKENGIALYLAVMNVNVSPDAKPTKE